MKKKQSISILVLVLMFLCVCPFAVVLDISPDTSGDSVVDIEDTRVSLPPTYTPLSRDSDTTDVWEPIATITPKSTNLASTLLPPTFTPEADRANELELEQSDDNPYGEGYSADLDALMAEHNATSTAIWAELELHLNTEQNYPSEEPVDITTVEEISATIEAIEATSEALYNGSYDPDDFVDSEDYRGGCMALCRDGTISYSASRRGTCSWHGGVASWRCP
jgi:hypothetical protein